MTIREHPKDWREARRLRAWELQQQGWKHNKIAEALGVSDGAVSQWLARARAEGVEGLRTRTTPGAPVRLSVEQRPQLPAFGFIGDVWTRARVAEVIKREFGVAYHPTIEITDICWLSVTFGEADVSAFSSDVRCSN